MKTKKIGRWGRAKALRLDAELKKIDVDVGEEVMVQSDNEYIIIRKLSLKEKNERG